MPAIREYRPGDENGVCRLFETCHKRPLPLDVWAWRYRPQPTGKPIAAVVEDRGEIVGHVCALPVRLERGGASRRAGLWVDLMIHPKYRNLDLFLDLAEADRKLCADAGVELLFAFPNDNSFSVLRRMLGWQDVTDIRALEAPLSALQRLKPGKAAPIESFGPAYDGLWAATRPSDAWAGARSASHLQWRYRGKPRAQYPAWSTEGGWLAAKVFKGPDGVIGDILDLWSRPGDVDALLAASAGFFEKAGASKISVWALPGTPQHGWLSERGFHQTGDVTHFAVRWTSDTRADLPVRPEDWNVAKGDSDVF